MKAGILTFYNADSYGAVLQSYALQQAVKGMGAECDLVNINMPSRKTAAAPAAPGTIPAGSPAAAIFAKKMMEAGNKRKALFEQFRKEYLVISKQYEQKDNPRTAL